MSVNALPLDLDVQMFLRLLIAVVLGALVGYEREGAGKPAGVALSSHSCNSLSLLMGS